MTLLTSNGAANNPVKFFHYNTPLLPFLPYVFTTITRQLQQFMLINRLIFTIVDGKKNKSEIRNIINILFECLE